MNQKNEVNGLRDALAGQCCAAMVSTIRDDRDYDRLRNIAHCHDLDSVSQFFARESYKQADAMLAERNRGAEPALDGDVEAAIKSLAALAAKKIVNSARFTAERGQLDSFARVHLRGQLAGIALVAMDSDVIASADAELCALITKADGVTP